MGCLSCFKSSNEDSQELVPVPKRDTEGGYAAITGSSSGRVSPTNVGLGSMTLSREVQSSSQTERNLMWLNFILESLWPKFRAAGNKMGREIAQKAIADVLADQKEASSVVDLRLVDITLDIGATPPKLAACRTYHCGHGDTEGVEIDFAMTFEPRQSYKFEALLQGKVSHVPVKINVGVKYFEISGVASLVLAPLFEEFPVFGGGRIFFLDTPSVKMQFSGMADLGRSLAPLLMSTLRNAVVKELQNGFVLPNAMFIPVKSIPLQTRVNLTSPLPEGCLAITVHQARGLKAADWNVFGKPTSDPVVEVGIGAAKFRTREIQKTLNPVWDPAETGYLFVHNPNQAVNLEVYDADVIGAHDFLAYLNGTSVIDVLEKTTAQATWMKLLPAPAGPNEHALKPEESNPEVQISSQFLEMMDLPDHVRQNKKPVRVQSATMRGSTAKPHPHGGPRKLDVDHVTLFRVVTVKLLGMDCPAPQAGSLYHAVCIVSLSPGDPPWKNTKVATTMDEPDKPQDKKPESHGFLHNLMRKVEGGLHMTHADDAPAKAEVRKSRKAALWGAEGGPKTAGLPEVNAQMQMMIEKLRYQKNMSFEEIASMCGMSAEQVKLLVELRRELKVVWHQAFHFLLEHPKATIDFEVKLLDGTSIGQVKGFDLQELGEETSIRKICEIGIPSFPNVHFEFEVEIRGLQRAKISLPKSDRRFGGDLFKGGVTNHLSVDVSSQ